ncbi:LPS translocon maturation chaperone LptM [Glycocaulis sp.]
MRATLLLVLFAALALGACGNRGSLERPAPLWGGERAADPSAEAAEAQEEADALFEDEDQTEDGLPTIPGQDLFEDDDWDD